MLKPVFDSDPKVDLRVLVLTDGESYGGMQARAVLPRINKIGVVVDAIIVGDRPDPDLVCERMHMCARGMLEYCVPACLPACQEFMREWWVGVRNNVCFLCMCVCSDVS